MYKTESQWLCLKCWQILHDFHKLYTHIENSHINLTGLLKTETDAPKTKDFISVNLLEPEMLLDQTVAFVKQEYKESDNDEEYKDEDDIPLIHMRPSDTNSLQDPINDNEQSLGDPLNKKEKTRQTKKRRAAPVTINATKHTKKLKHEKDTEREVNSDADASDMSASSLLITANASNSPLRYYYDSKVDISEYDAFIAQHFKLVCSKCQKSVSTFDELYHHFEETHKKKQGYVICCGTKYRKPGCLVDHINLHLNPEYFKCEHCSQVLTLRKHYINHMKTHKMEYSCDICDKKMVSIYLLNKHKLTHVPEDEKKFTCDTCEKW